MGTLSSAAVALTEFIMEDLKPAQIAEEYTSLKITKHPNRSPLKLNLMKLE